MFMVLRRSDFVSGETGDDLWGDIVDFIGEDIEKLSDDTDIEIHIDRGNIADRGLC